MTHKTLPYYFDIRKIFFEITSSSSSSNCTATPYVSSITSSNVYSQVKNITENYNFESQERSQTLSQFADHNHNLNNPHDFQNQVKQGLVLII